MAVRVVVGCYNRFVAEALRRLLTSEREISVIGVFSGEMDSKEFFQLKPDVMLLGSKIFQAVPENFNPAPRTKILLIGDHSLNPPPPQWLDEFICRGGAGILSPEADVPTLKKALVAISRGEIWLDRKTMSGILSRQADGRREGAKLTDTEKEVTALICLGCRNKEIARKLKVSEQTVKSHCNRIYKKVGVSDRLQCAIKLGRDPDLQNYVNRFRQ